jgi:hypothetical protein
MFVVNAILGALMAILTKVTTKAVLEKVIIIGLERLVKHSKSDVDDEVFAVVKGAIEGKQPTAKES